MAELKVSNFGLNDHMGVRANQSYLLSTIRSALSTGELGQQPITYVQNCTSCSNSGGHRNQQRSKHNAVKPTG